jgi:hypothetical protein
MMARSLWQLEERKRLQEEKALKEDREFWTAHARTLEKIETGYIDTKKIDYHKHNQFVEIEGYRFDFHIVEVPYRVGVNSFSVDKEAKHYQVKVTVQGSKDKYYISQYSMGSGLKYFPRAKEIFYSMLSDAQYGSYSFYDFCNELSYKTDHQDSRRIYDSCSEVYAWFRENYIQPSEITLWLEHLQEEENAG